MTAEVPLWVDPYPSRRMSDPAPGSAILHAVARLFAPVARRAAAFRARALACAAIRGAEEGDEALMARAVKAFCPEADRLTLHAAALIVRGAMVDCAAGERADAALAIAAATLAMRRPPVHIATVTPDDAAAFHERFRSGLRAIGLTAALIGSDTALEDRRRAYSSAVTIVPVGSLAEDALRDRLLLGRRRGLALKARRLMRRYPEPLMPGFRTLLCRGAGAMLLDGAHTQIVLRSNEALASNAPAIRQAVAVARQLAAEYYVLRGGRAELTGAGRAHLSAVAHLYPALAPGTGSGRLMVCEALAALAGTASGTTDDESLQPYRLVLNGSAPLAVPRTEEQDHLQQILAGYRMIAGQGAGILSDAAELRHLYGVRCVVRIGLARPNARIHARPGLVEARALLLLRFLAISARGDPPVLLVAPGRLDCEIPTELSDAPRLTPGDTTDRPVLVWGGFPTRRTAADAVCAPIIEQVVPLEGTVSFRVYRMLSSVPTAMLRAFAASAVYALLQRTEERRRAFHRREWTSYAMRVNRLMSFAGDAE